MPTAAARARWLGLAAAVGVAGCAPATNPTDSEAESPRPSEAQAQQPAVVVSHNVLCDITEQIAQERAELTCLISGDPHAYSPTPGDRRALEQADLVLHGGYNLVPAVEDLLEAIEAETPTVAVYEAVAPEPLAAAGHHHGHSHESNRDEGDSSHEHTPKGNEDQAQPDPHIWHDASYGIAITERIAQELAAVDSEGSEHYDRNAAAYRDDLERLDTWIREQIATIPPKQRHLITTHDAFAYYAEAYDLEGARSLQGLSTEDQPSAARVRELAATIQQAQVPTIFAEGTANDRALQTVAQEAGVEVAERLLLPTLDASETGGDTYIGMLARNTCTIVEGLGGQCEPFENN